MYIKQLTITDIRCFAQTTLEFGAGQRPTADCQFPNVTLLLGNNGAGKSSLLRSIALAVLAPILPDSGYVPYSLVRRTSTRQAQVGRVVATIALHGEDHVKGGRSLRTANVEATVTRRSDTETVRSPHQDAKWMSGLYAERSPAFFLVGYGATRRVESSATFDAAARQKTRLLRYMRVAGLFEDHVTLTPLQTWLPAFRKSNPGRYKQFVTLVNQLLPEGTRFTEKLERGEYLYLHGDSEVPFGALSDGYRAYIGWLNDLLYHVSVGVPNGILLRDIRGVVLVDEIDLHLHPEWQREVIPGLTRALPNIQFVFSTHSPIVAGTLQAANIAVLESDPTGESHIRRSDERVHGLNADQILTSSYFGLSSTRAPGVVNELRQLSQGVQAGNYDAALAFLQKLTKAKDAPPAAGATATTRTSSSASRRSKRRPKRLTTRKTARTVKR